MADTVLTREGYNKIEAELDYLRNVRRVEVSNRLHAAIEGGGDDLLENAELEAAKNEQAFVLGRIDDLSYLLSNAKVIDEPVNSGEVGVGEHPLSFWKKVKMNRKPTRSSVRRRLI